MTCQRSRRISGANKHVQMDAWNNEKGARVELTFAMRNIMSDSKKIAENWVESAITAMFM